MKLLRWSSLLAGSWGRDGWGFPRTGYVPGPRGEVSIERLHSQQKRRDPNSALCHAACRWQPTSVFLPTGEAECHCFKAPPQRAVEPSSGTWSEQALDSPFFQFCLPRILPAPHFPPLASFAFFSYPSLLSPYPCCRPPREALPYSLASGFLKSSVCPATLVMISVPTGSSLPISTCSNPVKCAFWTRWTQKFGFSCVLLW